MASYINERYTQENEMKAHRLAKYFPILEGEEFKMLVEDIRKNGQLEPVVTYNGEILDGINRARACEVIGIEPKTEEYTGDDPLSYVVSINVRRRHMDTSQRAMLATEMLPEFTLQAKDRLSKTASVNAKAKRPEGSTGFVSTGGSVDPGLGWRGEHRARDDAARVFSVSAPTIQRAKRIQEQAPERVADIIAGRATVSQIDEELREAKAEKHREQAQEKETKTLPVQHPKAVKDYLVSCAVYRDSLELAIKCARADMFDPSAISIITTKHNAIRALMAEMEELV
jgi:hypothetical protein